MLKQKSCSDIHDSIREMFELQNQQITILTEHCAELEQRLEALEERLSDDGK